MDKQTTIAFVLIGAILVVWLYVTAPEPPKQPVKDLKQTELKDTSKVSKTDSLKEKILPAKRDTVISTEIKELKPKGFIVIETDLIRAELSDRGANFEKFFLKKFNNWYSAHNNDGNDDYRKYVQLINYSRGGAFDIVFVTSEGQKINTADYSFNNESDNYKYKISENDSATIRLSLNLEDGRKVIKEYTFYGNKYEVKSNVIFEGMNNFINNNTYDVVWNNGIRFVEENSVDEANYANASVYYGEEFVTINAGSPGEKETKEFRGRVGWMAVKNKYFAAIVKPTSPEVAEGAYVEGTTEIGKDGGHREYYNVRLVMPFKNNAVEKESFTVYIGPADYAILENIDQTLVKLIDFGSFFGLKFIVRPIAEYVLLPLFKFLHSIIPNYGLVIVVFSLIIKIVVYPLTKSSYQSMKKMQALQPKIAEIKEKFKDDPQKMNKETMKLYSTYGINPAGGCLPILLQMPVFVALWGLFQTAIALRQQPFMLWITDLSKPDVIYDLGFKLPLFGIQQISGLALLMGVTTFVQQKMTMKDPKQAALVYIMPVMLTLLFMSFPSGLNLYYFLFNLFSIAQQYYINHKGGEVELVPVANPNKKKGFMARMMEAAEDQAKSQQKKKK